MITTTYVVDCRCCNWQQSYKQIGPAQRRLEKPCGKCDLTALRMTRTEVTETVVDEQPWDGETRKGRHLRRSLRWSS